MADHRRYRVLVVATHPVQYMAPILRRMAAHPGYHLHVAYCTLRGAERAHDPEFGTMVQWDVPLLDGYSWSQVPNRGSGEESFWGLRNPGLAELILQGNYDAVLCFTGYLRASFWIALRAARSANAAFLFGTDAITLSARDGQSWKRAVKRIVWPLLFRLADQVIVPSSATRDLIVSLGLSAERITLTPYSVDNDWWTKQSAAVDRGAVRSSWGASQADAVILFCAKLQPWKRPGDVLRAFAEAELSNAFLVFAGEGPLRPDLEKRAAHMGIRERVRFLGFVNQSQLPAVYTSADLMVLPSEYEPFAVVVNEAMCCGCPVAVSDHVGASRDLVTPVHREFVYPAGDVSALAGLLRTALSNREQLAAIGRAAAAHIQTWSPERNIAATLEAITTAVSRKAPRRFRPAPESASTVSSTAAPKKLRE